ncbi:hypothetical protein ACFE04_002812 [Oxalis oulophora]
MEVDLHYDDDESLTARVQQLERERNELRKDIEQLCMQQAGPTYLAAATRMHFQRTAALEQEIENFKSKLASRARENSNLQEELSEAYRIKSQLAELHASEVAKNKESEKQVKFFQGCVAAAFAERDHSIMEAEKAKEKEEFMSHKFNEMQKRLEELTSECVEQKNLIDTLQNDLAKEKELNKTFNMVVDKFYGIWRNTLEGLDNVSWDEKCTSLLHDPAEMWSFNDASTSKYISALEEELERVRKSMDNLQNKLRMGLDIENHLKKRVRELEKSKARSDKMNLRRISELRLCHSQHRVDIVNILEKEKCYIQSLVEEKIKHVDLKREQNPGPLSNSVKSEEFECPDVSNTSIAGPNLTSKGSDPSLCNNVHERNNDSSEALNLALQDKVATLLLLSQQDERHLLEKNVNAALQKKIEELQRNLLQVTNEKVKALMELAHLKQEYHLLQEKIRGKTDLTDTGERRLIVQGTDGRLRSLLKKTNLRRWIGADIHLNNEGNFLNSRSSGMDFARMKIENATLKESLESMEHLTSSIHRLRLSLVKVKESFNSEESSSTASETLDDIISEAKLVKTALGSSLPISWSAEADIQTVAETVGNEWESSLDKTDLVSAAGFEMVELAVLAAQAMKDHAINVTSS